MYTRVCVRRRRQLFLLLHRPKNKVCIYGFASRQPPQALLNKNELKWASPKKSWVNNIDVETLCKFQSRTWKIHFSSLHNPRKKRVRFNVHIKCVSKLFSGGLRRLVNITSIRSENDGRGQKAHRERFSGCFSHKNENSLKREKEVEACNYQ